MPPVRLWSTGGVSTTLPAVRLLALLGAAVLSTAPVLEPLAGPAIFAPATTVTVEAAQAAVPDAAAVSAAVGPALAAAPGVVHAEIRDAATGEVIHAQAEDDPVAPASAVKVLTAATALRTLGPDRTLRTRVVAVEPAAAGGPTELVLVGGGDALLGTGASDPSRVDGRAGLQTLAERTVAGLAERGVSGDVVVSTDLRLFEGAALNPVWGDSLAESGNITAVQPLAAYGGRERPGTGEDRVADPAAFAARTFQDRLDDAVAASGADLRVSVREQIPATAEARDAVLAAEPVAVVESAPVQEVAAYMLAHSENQVAETLAHASAYAVGRPATHDGAAALLEDVAADLGLDTAGMALVDASGLSGENRASAAQLAGLVTALAWVPGLTPVLDGLPRPGEDSTLAERFRGTAAEDAVAAKTGTLGQTVSLTGTVETTSGRVLTFSIVTADIDWKVDEARAAIDAAVTALAEL